MSRPTDAPTPAGAPGTRPAGPPRRHRLGPGRAAAAPALLALVLALAGPGASNAGAAPRPAAAATRLLLEDAAGRPLGEVLALDQSGVTAVVILVLDGHPVPLVVIGDRDAVGTTELAFESTDCTGPPLLLAPVFLPNRPAGPWAPAPGDALATIYPLSATDLAAVLHRGTGPREVRLVGSFVAASIDGPECLAIAGPEALEVEPAVPVLDLAAVPAPFAVALGAGPARALAAPRVVTDAAGVALGRVAVPDETSRLTRAGLAVPVGDLGQAFVTVTDGQVDEARLPLLFESPDCTGPPFLPALPSLFVPAGLDLEGRLHVPDGPAGPITRRSALVRALDPPCVLTDPPVAIDATPARVARDLGGLQPPLAVTPGLRPGPLVVEGPSGAPRGLMVGGGGDFTGGSAAVLVPVGSRLALVRARAEGVQDGTSPVAFESADCTGPAWLLAADQLAPPRAPLVPRTGVALDGSLLVESSPAFSLTMVARLDRLALDGPLACAPVAPPQERRGHLAVPLLPPEALAGPLRAR
jgi:hypothetical protein